MPVIWQKASYSILWIKIWPYQCWKGNYWISVLGCMYIFAWSRLYKRRNRLHIYVWGWFWNSVVLKSEGIKPWFFAGAQFWALQSIKLEMLVRLDRHSALKVQHANFIRSRCSSYHCVFCQHFNSLKVSRIVWYRHDGMYNFSSRSRSNFKFLHMAYIKMSIWRKTCRS